jgi:H+/Cl- antiporter ClcA
MTKPLPPAQQLRLRENQVFLILTIVIGVVAGLSAVLFTVAIEQTSHRLFGLAPSRLRLFAIPPLMSIVTGILLAKVFPDVRGSGVPQTETAYHLAGGVIPAASRSASSSPAFCVSAPAIRWDARVRRYRSAPALPPSSVAGCACRQNAFGT